MSYCFFKTCRGIQKKEFVKTLKLEDLLLKIDW